jgi:hypothetical protein
MHLVGTFGELRGLVQSNPTQGTKNVTLVCMFVCVCVCVFSPSIEHVQSLQADPWRKEP